MQAINPAGAYLLDSGRIFVLWLGKNLPPAFYSQVGHPNTMRADLGTANRTLVAMFAHALVFAEGSCS
jgi:hypothetical protein